MVTHPSTNRARRRVTSLLEINALPLSQAGTGGVITFSTLELFTIMRYINLYFTYLLTTYTCDRGD